MKEKEKREKVGPFKKEMHFGQTFVLSRIGFTIRMLQEMGLLPVYALKRFLHLNNCPVTSCPVSFKASIAHPDY